MNRQEVLEHVSTITEFNDLSDFMKDEELDYLLASVIKLMAKDSLSVPTAANLIVKLQAYSAKMGINAGYYAHLNRGGAGTENAKKKNVYYTMNDKIDRVVDALKIYVRYIQ